VSTVDCAFAAIVMHTSAKAEKKVFFIVFRLKNE
jgi:hypothetical protein